MVFISRPQLEIVPLIDPVSSIETWTAVIVVLLLLLFHHSNLHIYMPCGYNICVTGALNMVGQYKWDAYSSNKGMSKEDAKRAYVAMCQELQHSINKPGASKTQKRGGGMQQSQSMMQHIEGAAKDGERDLTVLIYEKQYDELQSTIHTTADIDAPNEYGETALHFACDRGYSRAIEILLSAKASASAKNNDGETPLHMLMCSDAIACIDMIITAKVCDTKGITI